MNKETKEKAVGVVKDYFRKVGVAAVEVTSGKIKVGDTLKFLGHSTDFDQKIDSMQVNHQPVMVANPGDLVGILVSERVRDNDLVFLSSGKGEEKE